MTPNYTYMIINTVPLRDLTGGVIEPFTAVLNVRQSDLDKPLHSIFCNNVLFMRHVKQPDNPYIIRVRDDRCDCYTRTYLVDGVEINFPHKMILDKYSRICFDISHCPFCGRKLDGRSVQEGTREWLAYIQRRFEAGETTTCIPPKGTDT